MIDEKLKTPYNSLTPVEMMEYKAVDDELFWIDRQKKKEQKEAQRKQKIIYRSLYKVACACGIM